jgi:hypothetical protein
MCPSVATYLSADYKNPFKRVGLVQSRSHHHLIEILTSSRHDIAEKLLRWHLTTINEIQRASHCMFIHENVYQRKHIKPLYVRLF